MDFFLIRSSEKYLRNGAIFAPFFYNLSAFLKCYAKTAGLLVEKNSVQLRIVSDGL